MKRKIINVDISTGSQKHWPGTDRITVLRTGEPGRVTYRLKDETRFRRVVGMQLLLADFASDTVTLPERTRETPKRIRIVKVSKSFYWYHSEIGKEYDVLRAEYTGTPDYVLLDDDGETLGYVEIADCEPVPAAPGV